MVIVNQYWFENRFLELFVFLVQKSIKLIDKLIWQWPMTLTTIFLNVLRAIIYSANWIVNKNITSTCMRFDDWGDCEDASLLDVAKRKVEIVDQELHVGDVTQGLTARGFARTIKLAFALVLFCNRNVKNVKHFNKSCMTVFIEGFRYLILQILKVQNQLKPR
jgi:hypothetical protein